MDVSTPTLDALEAYSDPSFQTLSYDETPYEEQLPTAAEARLANRIGSTKVYLLSESSAVPVRPRTGGGKRKRDEEAEDSEIDGDVEMDGDPTLRPNALLLHGTPISNLPTVRLFAYATHFDVHPMGLEWVDDNTCILVFSSKSSARTGLRYLTKSPTEDPDPEGYLTAKPIPISFWPPEEQINRSLGKNQDRPSPMKGVIKIRWARTDDVKKRGAKGDSEFYKKHGRMAGKELFNGRELPMKKRRRNEDGSEMDRIDPVLRKEQLDDDLNRFLAEGEAEDAAALVELDLEEHPPSKMRSDYIVDDRRKLRLDLASRLLAPLPRRARKDQNTNRGGTRLQDRLWEDKVDLSERITSEKIPRIGRIQDRRGRRDRAHGNRDRPKKSQQELDDELDAFLREE